MAENLLSGDKELKRKLKDMGKNVKGVLVKAVEAGAEPVLRDANQDAPGPNVIAKVTLKTQKKAEISIGPDKEHWYYRFLETGAQPHEIKASNGGLLMFEGESGTVMTSQVSHTGMAAKPYLRPAVSKNEGAASDAARTIFKTEIEKEVE